MIDRDAVIELVDRVEVHGLGYMLLLYMLNGATVSELTLMTCEDRHTIGSCLRKLEMRQYTIRVQHGSGYKWFLSEKGLSLVRLEVGGNYANLPAPAREKQPLSPSEISTFLGQVTDQGLMCLFVLWANPQPVTIGDIETITGVCRHTTSEALDRLKLHGYAAEVGGGRWPRWTLTDRGRQLSLPGLNAPGLAESDGQKMTINAPTTTTAILSPLDYVKAAVAAESDGQKMTINPKLAAALKAAGIGSNAWPQLAKLEHVTPAYVKAHDAYRRECGESTGLLITRLKCGDPVPETKRTPVRDGSDVAAAWQKFLDEPRDNQRRK